MKVADIKAIKFPMKVIGKEEHYDKKPSDAKTVKQWLDKGMKPKDESVIEYFEMPFLRNGQKQAYAYVREKDIVPLTVEDLIELETDTLNKKIAKEEEREKREQERSRLKEEEKENEKVSLFKSIASLSSKNVVFFDTETTGFSPAKGDEILQISITDKNSDVIFETYIKPNNKKDWYSAEKVHGISPKMVSKSPRAKDVSPEIGYIFENAAAIVGHNVAFDVRFVEGCLGISIPEEKIFDTMKIFRACEKNESYSLESAVKTFCPEYYDEYKAGAHDSTTDTKATAKVFMAQAEYAMDYLNSKGIGIDDVVVKMNSFKIEEPSCDYDEDPDYF